MDLNQKVAAGLKQAMINKDEARKRTLRAIKSQILLFKTDGKNNELTLDLEIKMVQKMVKERQDSYDIYMKQNREDLASVEKEEIDILKEYLPAQMDIIELRNQIKHIIDELGASSMKEMGKVMGIASKKFAGVSDGKTISSIVRELLSS